MRLTCRRFFFGPELNFKATMEKSINILGLEELKSRNVIVSLIVISWKAVCAGSLS